jgi:diacylglycerol kinase (ATP)
MTPNRVRILLNPKAGAGVALRRLNQIREALRGLSLEHDVVETGAPGDGARLAREAATEGVDVLAVVGGDGTLNEVVQAYIDDAGEARPGPALCVVPAGTGGDYKRTLGLGGEVAEAVGRIRTGQLRAMDLGLLRIVGNDREPATRAFLNITSVGIGGVTDRLVNEAPKWMGGKATFFLGSLRAMFQYRNTPVRVRVDGVLLCEEPIFNVAMANGRYFGGGMKIAPDADPSDGLFDVVALGNISTAAALALSGKIYAGTHLAMPNVYTARGRVVEAEPVHPWASVLIDMDGETPGQLPLKATVLPGAIRVYTA